MAPSPPAMLMDEIVEEVLFRIPPDDPMTLVRAAVVCKQWRRLVSDPGFHRWFREFHGTPPMLGVLCNSDNSTYKSRFIPTSSFRSSREIMSGFHVADARHGRVLFCTANRGAFAIWDPIKDEIISMLPRPPFVSEYTSRGPAAVLCAAATTTGDGCDHLHCQRGPFRVVCVRASMGEGVFFYFYSSEDGLWRKHSLSQQVRVPCFDINHTIVPIELIQNAIYFVLGFSDMEILKCDLTTRDTSVIRTPTDSYGYGSRWVLMTTEKGELGFARARRSV